MKKGYWYIAATTFFFSTAEIGSKLVAHQINPFQLVFLRFLIGGLFLLPFALVEIKRRGLKLHWKDWLYFLLTGFLGVTVSMSLYQYSLMLASASVVAVVFSTNTIFVALFAVLLLKERFTLNAAAAIGLGLVGVGFILNPFGHSPNLAGVLLCLASAVLFALYGVIGTTRVGLYGGFLLNSFSFLAGVLLMLPVLLITGAPVFSGITASNIWTILYLGIFVTGLGYLCYLTAMKETSAIETSAVFFIKPALAPLLASIVLGEGVGGGLAIGIVFIVAGAFIMFWKKLAGTKTRKQQGFHS